VDEKSGEGSHATMGRTVDLFFVLVFFVYPFLFFFVCRRRRWFRCGEIWSADEERCSQHLVEEESWNHEERLLLQQQREESWRLER